MNDDRQETAAQREIKKHTIILIDRKTEKLPSCYNISSVLSML